MLHSVSSSPTSKCLQRVTVRGIHSDKDYRGHTIPTGSRSVSAARPGMPPKLCAARCGAELLSNP